MRRLVRTHKPRITSVAALLLLASALTGQGRSQQALPKISVNVHASQGGNDSEATPFQTITDIIRGDDDAAKNKDRDKDKNQIKIYVDSEATPDGDGSRRTPFQTIADGVIRARELRNEEPTRIVIRVAPGTYTENDPLYVNVSNLELRGSTRLILNDKGLPQDCGVDNDPSPCIEAGTETLITPEVLLPSGEALFTVAPTRDMSAATLYDIDIRGFVFDGQAINVTLAGTAIFIDRVSNFLIRQNVIRHGAPGVVTRLSSGTMKSNFAYSNVDGFSAGGGSQLDPAHVTLVANRSTQNNNGMVVTGTAGVKWQNDDLNLTEIQTIFDPSQHPEQVPATLVIKVIGNDFSNNTMFGVRFEQYGPGSLFYDTTDNQPMTANVTAVVHGNTCRNNLEYGFLVEGAFAPRINPRKFTGLFRGSFMNNDLSGHARAGLFVGFMLNGQVTRNPGLINTTQYLTDSLFDLRVAAGDSSDGIDYDNPILDRFDGITPLNNTLLINGELITGTYVTCPPGFACNP